jgi:hypothetical protein
MPGWRVLLIVLLVAGGFAAAAGDAVALNPATVDCSAHDKLTGHYTVTQLHNALATMPASVKEYTNCYNVINTQLQTQLGTVKASDASSGSGGSSSSSAPLIIALVVIVLGGGGFAIYARRRGGGGVT